MTTGPEKRVALVTGAGRGIGRAVALALSNAGHPVALTARSRDEIEGVCAEIGSAGGTAWAKAADVTREAEVTDLVDDVAARLGAPLVLVNNAGAAGSHKLVDHPDDLWERMLDVNLTGAFRITRAVAPTMLAAGWGRVINVGSVASLSGAPYIAAYTAAKHGLLGLTRALAAEWVRRGVTVNLVAPGYVDTAMTSTTVTNIARRTGTDEAAARDVITRLSPQHRLVQPAEVAAAVAFLASDAAAATTGATLTLDGGASTIAATG